MNSNRRQFLQALSLISGAAVLAPEVLVSAAQAQTSGNGKAAKDFTGWKVTGTHWGAVRARVEGDRVVEIKPFEHDADPTEMINGLIGSIYSSSRVRYPMVRLDWYKNREKSDRTQRGDNRFVRVSWD